MLSQRTRYTLRALQYLADRFGEGPVQLKEIAESQNIPAKFLTVILSEMSREGLVGTQRGREGGYWLLLPPVDVRYGDIRSEEHTSELQSLMRISYAVFRLKTKTE